MWMKNLHKKCIKDSSVYKGLINKDDWDGYGFKLENVEKINPIETNGKFKFMGLWLRNLKNKQLWRISMKTMHNMNLNNGPFNRIKMGQKTIELRLNDEKRQLLKENDLIEFTNRETLDVIMVEVVRLYKYSNFEELYKHFNKIAMGYDKEDIANPKDMEKYYSKEEQDKYGVIGIEIRVLEDRKWNKWKIIDKIRRSIGWLRFN